MELTVHHPDPAKRRDECHGIEATARVEALVRGSGRRVRLTAQHASSRSDRRLARHVAVRRGGRWQDVGAILMAEGHTLFLSNPKESAWNLRYGELGQRAGSPAGVSGTRRTAAPAPRRTSRCGSGRTGTRPASTTSISTASGPRCATTAPDRAVSLARLVDPRQHAAPLHRPGRHRPRARARRSRCTPAAARTTASPSTGGSASRSIPNPEDGGEGDGAYLFDPQGDLRAAMTYPCLVACEHPDAGALRLEADPGGTRP